MKGRKRFVRVNPTASMILNGLLGDEAVEITPPAGPFEVGVEYVFTATTDLEGPQFEWSLEPGLEILSGQGTDTVTIRFVSPGIRSVRVAVTDATGMTYRAAFMEHVSGPEPEPGEYWPKLDFTDPRNSMYSVGGF